MSTAGNQGETPATDPKGVKPEQATTQEASAKELAFDEWLQQQDENTRKRFDEGVAGLKSALKSERTEKGDIARQLKELAKKADEGSTIRAELERLTAENEKTARRADFVEQAVVAGVSDLKLAWRAVDGVSEFLDRRGNFDFEALKKAHPSLFAAPRVPEGNAGRGLGGGLPKQSTSAAMNAFIRSAAGVAT